MLLASKKHSLYSDVIGITGIIGSGKSTALDLFQKEGYCTVSADKLARTVLSKDYAQYSQVVGKLKKHFLKICMLEQKRSFIMPDNTINRTILAKVVFCNHKRVRTINKIMHQHIEKLFVAYKKEATTNLPIIYEVPLLFELNLQRYFRKTILVYAPLETITKRLEKRDGFNDSVKNRFKYQISIEAKKDIADYIIENSFTKKQLYNEVLRMSNIIKGRKE